MLLKLFPATVANTDIGSLKSLPLKMIVLHASEIWTKLYGPNYTKFWAFWQKKKKKKTFFFFFFFFFLTIFDKDTILEDVYIAKTIV